MPLINGCCCWDSLKTGSKGAAAFTFVSFYFIYFYIHLFKYHYYNAMNLSYYINVCE